jgi:hypothetical protein
MGWTPPDSDGDGLPDKWELRYFGSINAARGGPDDDFDGDRMCNLHEYYAGTDPTDPESMLQISRFTHDGSRNEVVIEWLSASNKTYAIESAATLVEGFVHTLTNAIPATPPVNTCTVEVDRAGAEFYRVVKE